MKIIALFTCFNRREKTQNCIRTLVEGNPGVEIEFVIVDDGSTDGTAALLEQMKQQYMIHTIRTRGNLFYSGGMRIGMEYIQLHNLASDYILMLNDDVRFYSHAVEKLIGQSKKKEDAVIVGVTCAEDGTYTYGAICYTKGIHYIGVGIEYPNKKCDTFNANCVLIPRNIFEAVPIMDSHYVHSLGDFDYGLSIKNSGYQIYPSDEYVGVCERNSNINTWSDKSLSRWERIKKKENIKGSPTKQWFYFLKKNFGFWMAVRKIVTPYIKIVIGK